MAPLTPVYWQTISPPMHQLLRLLGQASLLRDFYLAGGTALALRLGHRYSIDLNFFFYHQLGGTADTPHNCRHVVGTTGTSA